MNQEFLNPYEKEYQSFNGPDKNLCRAPASIDKDAYEFIRGIRPNMGTINTTQCLLWSKLIIILKKYGITDITKKSEFESLVANLVFVDGRTIGRDGVETVDGNDRRRTKSTRTKDKNVKDKQPDTSGANDQQGE